jgi:hypothetical protein
MARSDPFLEELQRVSADLDRLIADRTTGQPSQPRHDGHIDQAEALAARLRGVGRGPGRPVNPPIGRTAAGGHIW